MSAATVAMRARVITPRATYRLQLNREFPFAAARACVPYLAALGISHLYLSPIFQARPGSAHGYDVTNHAALNPEIGTREEFVELCGLAREHGLGLILDIVPNHMAVMSDDNAWWLDVLENGPAARYASYFDIDWRPLRASMRDRLLVPVLGERYGDELRKGNIQIVFDRARGSFHARYGSNVLPLDPREYSRIFAREPFRIVSYSAELIDNYENADERVEDMQELASILDEFARLPSRSELSPQSRSRRYRDKEVFKRRLARLCARSEHVATAIDAAVARLNDASDAESFELLAQLLEAQSYRLAFWRVAGDEINYRRFFDVNQLAALRIEEREVFAATHRLVLELVADRYVDGLRVDHIDGLHDPKHYLIALRQSVADRDEESPYIIVEKILASHERLREDWPIQGTTGYEFGAMLTNWLVAPEGLIALEHTYRQYVRRADEYADIVYECKKLLMRGSLAAEIAVLAVQLDRIAQAHPDTMDFTQFALRDALTEVIAAFPVYRTYITASEITADDRQSIAWAIGAARKRNIASDRSIFDFVESVLLAKPEFAGSEERRRAMIDFTMKFQQVTSPVMAKAVEDTAFYRYARLIALNEVGDDPSTKGASNAAVHKFLKERSTQWPHTLNGTSTHDSKRSEDVRYRLAVLSECSDEWRDHVAKWSRFNRGSRRMRAEGAVLTRNDEYFLLQTMLGIWPIDTTELDTWIPRMKEYVLKAIREAKCATSWIDPNDDYEAAAMEFVETMLTSPRVEHFREEFGALIDKLAFFGMCNSLSATVLKCLAPGVPDFYQGTELPELMLADPDNRRAVDFDKRRSICESVKSINKTTDVTRLLESWRDGRIKLWLIAKLLELRKDKSDLYSTGDYEPLRVSGDYAEHVLAFVRHGEGATLIVVVSRFTATLMEGTIEPPLRERWKRTRVHLADSDREGDYTEMLARRSVEIKCSEDDVYFEAQELFSVLPVAVLLQGRSQ